MNKEKDNLSIYAKYLDLIYYSNDIVRKFPKSEQFSLVKEIKNTLYSGLKSIMYSVKIFNKQDKLKYLKDLDIQLCILKVHVRIAFRYKYISMQNYETWSSNITDICNLLGGWIKSCQGK